MMIGHDHIDAQTRGLCHVLQRSNPAIHRDHERGSDGPGSLNAGRTKIVSITSSVRDEGHGLRSDAAKAYRNERRGAHSVRVVVAVDEDGFRRFDRPADPVNRRLHVGERERIVQLVESGAQERARLLELQEVVSSQ